MKRISLLLLVLVAGTFAHWLTRTAADPDSQSGSEAPTPRTPQTSQQQAPAAVSASDAAPSAASPMPSPASAKRAAPLPIDADFGDLFESIETRARAGEVEARCALGLLLTHCDFLLHPPHAGSPGRLWLEATQSIAESEADEPNAVLAQWDEVLEGDRAECRRIVQGQTRPGFWNFIEGARRGHLPSMRRVVMAIGLDEATLLSDPLLYQAYRAELGPNLVRLIELGDPWAAQMWANALFAGRKSALSAVLPAQWQTPGVALALAREVDFARRILSPVDVSDRITTEDQARAEALFSKYFAHSPIFHEPALETPEELRRQARSGRDLMRPPLRECGLQTNR
jgi:hypothetical protein